jgi:methyl-accepting chemotaxis protein
MKTFLALCERSERTILTSLGRRLACFLLLFVFNLGFVAIYVGERRVIIDALRGAGADNSLFLPIVAALQYGVTWTVILYAFVFFSGLLQIACMRHLIVCSES